MLRKHKDGKWPIKILAIAGLVFAVLFIVIQLIPIGDLGVNFSTESYIIFAVWIVLGVIFFIWQEFSKKKHAKEEPQENVEATK